MIPALNIRKLRLDLGDYLLSVAGLRKKIGGYEALAGVDLDVKRGSMTALVGPPGAGKTLTLACIAGVVRPSSGRVRYFGYEVGGRGELLVTRMGVARTHQVPQTFAGLSVWESVTAGALLRRPRMERAQAHAREIVHLAGLEGRLTTPVERIDPAERQRLVVAQALATDPQLLLLDDVCAGLDADGIAGMLALVAAIGERRVTVVAAAQTRSDVAQIANEVVHIDRGTTAR